MTATKYAGNYIYKADNLGEKLQFFNHPEGYVQPTQNPSIPWLYVYQYKDHLGNIRLSYADSDNNGQVVVSEIIEENNYFPGGLKHKGYNNQVSAFGDHPYGFNGKEENDELELGTLDFGARNYDPALMRWMNIDPLAELMRRHSPYNFAFNNPMRFVDPDGMSPSDVIIEGSAEFKKEALANLQKLTDNTLEIDDTGKVTESGCGGTETCSEGTNLVSNLINRNEVVTIVQTEGGNLTIIGGDEGSVTDGVGDSTVLFNPDKTTGGADIDGNKERPTQVGLGHELGHSKQIADGKGAVPEGQSDYVEPFEDLPYEERFEKNSTIYNTFYPIMNWEIDVRINVENPIRAEQGAKPRKLVEKNKFKYDNKY